MSFLEGGNSGVLVSGTTQLVAAPSAGVRRLIRSVIATNVDFQKQYLSIGVLNSGTFRRIWQGNLDPNDSFASEEVIVLDSPYKSLQAITTGNMNNFPEYVIGYADVNAPSQTINTVTVNTSNVPAFTARLSLKSDVYFSESQVYSGTSLYLVPLYGAVITLYNTGTATWEDNTINSQITKSLSGMLSGTIYDVFVFKSGTSLHLETVAWTSDTARVALDTLNGIPVKAGANNKRLVGSIRTTGTGLCDDNQVKRFVSNLYNRKKTKLYKKESTDNWTYNSSTWRYVNGDSSNKLELINCYSDIYLELVASLLGSRITNGAYSTGIGVNTIATETNDITDGVYLEDAQASKARAELRHYPSLGLSYYAWMEKTSGSDSFFGDAGDPTFYQSAIVGIVEM